MPYASIDELPESVQSALKKLPHALKMYKEVFNNAWEEYKDSDDRRGSAGREEVAHRVAWSAVKQKYEKDSEGEWRPKK